MSKIIKINDKIIENNILFLDDVINSRMSTQIIAQLLYYDSISEVGKPIKMYINSPGGSVVDGFAIIDTMSHLKRDVHTIIIGECSSMAVLVSITGNKRFMYKHAEMMIHGISSYSNGYEKYADLIVRYKNASDITKTLQNYIYEHSIIKEKNIDWKVDNYFNANRAKKLKLIDYII